MSVSGVPKLLAKFAAKKKAGRSVSGVVGFSTDYALRVHEDLQMFHPNGGKAKYLSDPLRRLRKELVGTVADTMRRGGTYKQGIYLACLHLQAAAQEEVPVDTGLLKNSAFSRVDGVSDGGG